uniref:RNA polymerase sigma factor n=1 Tax=Solibacter usitatus (strain Ellin6076) TaxID=234267 RepID=Q025A7_SOLUE
MSAPEELVEHLFRHQAGRMVSTLTRILGPRNLQLAEDVVQEALIRALELWPHRGIPANPAAWLIEVARNRALDVLRREASLAAKADELTRVFSAAIAGAEGMDDQLAMIFLCAHPAIPHEARVALTLKTVCGFSTSEIARAFLIQEPAAAQRIVRAKRLVRDLNFALPEDGELAARRESVLEVLYLMFNEGYTRNAVDLCEEAIRLGILVADHPATHAPEVDALLALFLLLSARTPARIDHRGDLFLLADQDRRLWNGERISDGMRRLDRSAAGYRVSTYHLEAAIAAAHATASDFASTDWCFIVDQYDQLFALNPSPVIALNRAVAISRAEGAAAGLRALAVIEHHPALASYYLLHATRARLHEELGNHPSAALSYGRALECGCSPAERRFLERQATEPRP